MLTEKTLVLIEQARDELQKLGDCTMEELIEAAENGLTRGNWTVEEMNEYIVESIGSFIEENEASDSE